MGTLELKKKQKRESLLDTAFTLFMSKGFQNTSISDIVNRAGVAKGTFYLYFTDKYDIRNKLIAHKAARLFLDACEALSQHPVCDFEEQMIYLTDYVIRRFEKEPSLLGFISKHLSWGVFRNSLVESKDGSDHDAYTAFLALLHASGHEFRDPEIMIYMIIELVSGAIYNPLLYRQPASMEEIRPYLYEAVRQQIRNHIL